MKVHLGPAYDPGLLHRVSEVVRIGKLRGLLQPAPAPRERRPRRQALTPADREQVLALLHEERFVDLPPAQVWAQVLDAGQVPPGSIHTMYRVLAATAEHLSTSMHARSLARALPRPASLPLRPVGSGRRRCGPSSSSSPLALEIEAQRPGLPA